MLNPYTAVLICTSPSIEEEVTLEINGLTLVAFASAWSSRIAVGEVCRVRFTLNFWEDCMMEAVDDVRREIRRIGDSYSYWLQGKLNVEGQTIDAGLEFELDGELLMDYGWLDGRSVRIKVDRLDVEMVKVLPDV